MSKAVRLLPIFPRTGTALHFFCLLLINVSTCETSQRWDSVDVSFLPRGDACFVT